MSSKASPARQDSGRYAFIDTLRGLAAVYVLFFHVVYIPSPILKVSPSLFPFIEKGYSGVTLFFVLSAFTMVNSMRGRASEPARDLRFYIRRIFRIVPLYYFWLALFLLRAWFERGVTYPFARVLPTLLFTYNFIPGQEEGLVWASWTLGVEMIFYLIFPLLFRYVTSLRRSLVFILITACLSPAYHLVVGQLSLPAAEAGKFFHFGFLKQLPAFAVGILVFHLYERFIEGRDVPARWSIGLLACAALGFGFYARFAPAFMDGGLDEVYIQSVLYSAVVLGLAIRPWKLIVNPLTVFLGTISYSLYLAHPVVISYLVPAYARIYALPLRSTVSYAACALLTLLLVVLLSYLTYRLIEKPGMRLGSQLSTRLKDPSPLQPVLKTGDTG